MRFGTSHPGPFAGVDQHPVLAEHRQRRRGVAALHHHPRNLQPILRRKLEVPLVMRRHAHNRARPIVGQDVVRHPDRHLFPIKRIDGKPPGVEALLLQRPQPIACPRQPLLLDHGLQLRLQPVVFPQLRGKRMLRSNLDRGRAEDRVDPCRKHLDRGPTRNHVEVDKRPFAPANPVALHRAHLFRPTLQRVEPRQQLIRILRNAQKPLRQIPLLDRHILVPPAPPRHHLLVREHRRTRRAPVHLALLPVRQAALKHLDEEPLVPPVVVRLAGRHLVRPVEPHAQPRELLLHRRDILQRPLPRRHLVLQRRIFRRQSKRIPPHRVQHVVPAHPHVPRQRIADRIVPHMPNVQRAARVRQHLQAVVLRLAAVVPFRRIQRCVRVPTRLPLRFQLRRAIRPDLRLLRTLNHHPSIVKRASPKPAIPCIPRSLYPCSGCPLIPAAKRR